jgi:ABC-type glycerol-3-phosphate transport system permease component
LSNTDELAPGADPAVNGAGRHGTPPRGGRAGRAVLYVVLVTYSLTSIGAFMWMLSLSLKSNPEFLSTNPLSLPLAPSLDSYASAWTTAKIGLFFANTVFVTVTSVGVSVVVSALAAYAFARIRFPGSAALQLLFTMGLMVPGFLIIVPLYFFMRDLHLLGSLIGLILVYVAVTIPFNIYMLTPYFRLLPTELEEAAYIDGAGPGRTFLLVMLPLAAPGLTSVIVLNVLTIWNEFFFAFVLLSDQNSFTIPMGLQGLSVAATYSAKWVELFAGLILSMVPVLVIFALAQGRITRGLTVGGVKG